MKRVTIFLAFVFVAPSVGVFETIQPSMAASKTTLSASSEATACSKGQMFVQGYTADGAKVSGCRESAAVEKLALFAAPPSFFTAGADSMNTVSKNASTPIPPPPPMTRQQEQQARAASNTGYGICYTAHVQGIGWQPWVCDGAVAGTTGQSLRMEALGIHIYIPDNQGGDFYMRGHVQNIGWMPMQHEVIDMGNSTPEPSLDMYVGTTGQSLRLEAIRLMTLGCYCGTFHAQAHVQNIGWQSPAVGNDLYIGTTGQSLRLEAVKLQFTPY